MSQLNKEAKVLTFYNHKGGVSKTVSTFNFAHLLAEKGNKVLVIDADPQCNITEIMLSSEINRLDQIEKETGKEQTIPGSSLLELLKPRIEGAIGEVNIDNVQAIAINKNLDLIRGDVNLSSIEDSLAEAHIQRFSSKTHEKRTYVALGDFITRFSRKGNYNYVLLDMGPSSGALTRSCFLACDAFFIPTSPDRFNVQAIGTLSTILDRWLTEHNEIYEAFKKIDLPIKHGKPKFLGITVQHFKQIGGKPKPGFQLWIDRIPSRVVDLLIPVLKKHSTPDRDLTSGLCNDTIQATAIPDFGSMAPLMQECGKAVFQIKQSDTAQITENQKPWTGGTWNDAQRRIKHFRESYENLLKRMSAI